MSSALACEKSVDYDGDAHADGDGFSDILSLLKCMKERQDELFSNQALHYHNLMMELSRFHGRLPERLAQECVAKTDSHALVAPKQKSATPVRVSMAQRVDDFNKLRQTATASAAIDRGTCAWLRPHVKSQRFDNFSAFVLITNTVFLGVQVNYGYDERFTQALFIIDSIYAVLFAMEIALRLMADGLRTFFLGVDNRWNIFDFTVVSLSSIDTILAVVFPNGIPMADVSVVRIIRTVRITRVLRIIRVMKFFREMRIMIAAIFSTLKTAFWAFCLTIAISYVFAVAITQLVGDFLHTMNARSEADADPVLLKYFGGVSSTLLALFMSVAGGISWEDALRALFDVGIIPSILMLGYIIFTSLCMLNVIVGIFCQNAVEAFDQDKDRVIEYRLSEQERYIDLLTDLFNQWDADGQGKISLEIFEKHIKEKEVQALLESMEVDTKDALMLFELLDSGEGGDGDGALDLCEFVEGCITVRGSAKAIHMEKSLVVQKTLQQNMSSVMKKVNDVYNLMLQHVAEANKINKGASKVASL
eukprot:TRINITY_DN4674_c0_g1_i1.p1 TRINITY_DN4674_c0_g1~~TRINITY_DN4674_c0_g1_i1.p1  ORF type:complete len:533 (+),score=91.66 TRINITY_DN4674_c0_g1_i1:95-1693(+)